MTHPFLADPERQRAFDHLTAVPTGSVRAWAEQLGWKVGRFRRFLDSLIRYRLGEIETTPFGTTFKPIAHKVRPCGARVAHTLGSTGVKSTGPSARTRKPGANSVTEVPWSAFAVRLIPAMNEEFGRLIADYQPVRADNRGSHRAGHELEAARVDPDWCEERLRQMCRSFNPAKHGRGEPPRTLAYFTRGLIRDWQQYWLNLMAVERSGNKAAVPAREAEPEKPLESVSPPAPPQPPLSVEAQEAWRTAFQTAEPGRRLEIA